MGQGVEEYAGPILFESPAGTKRAIHALTDALWLTFHPTEDVEHFERDFIIEEDT